MTFKKIITFNQKQDDRDIWAEMTKSVAFVQGMYCHPFPSEYFENIDWQFNDTLSYCEAHSYYTSEESYKKWNEMYGEVMEEIYLEMLNEFESLEITIERFVDNVEISGMNDAKPIEQFVSKISSK